MRALFLSPYPSSLIRVRPFNWIKHLAARGHQITLLALVSSAQEAADLKQVARYCHQVEGITFPRWRPPWNLLLALPRPSLPLQAAYTSSPAMARRIRQTLRRKTFDIVHIEHLRGSTFATAVDGVPTVWDSVDCISLLFERTLQSGPSLSSRLMARADLSRTRRYEARQVSRHAATLVTSPEDRDALWSLVQRWGDPSTGQVVVLPNGVDMVCFAPQELSRPNRYITIPSPFTRAECGLLPPSLDRPGRSASLLVHTPNYLASQSARSGNVRLGYRCGWEWGHHQQMTPVTNLTS